MYEPDDSWLARNPEPAAGSPVMAWFNSDGYAAGARNAGLTMPASPDRDEAVAWNGYEMRSYAGVPKQGIIPRDLQLDLVQAYAACVSYTDARVV